MKFIFITVILLVYCLSFIQSVKAASWVTNSPMNVARYGHTATLLPNGNVIVVGGRDSNDVSLASAELYNPSTGKWTMTGSLNIARYDHTATLLTSGKLLVVGGIGVQAISIVEMYDPATGVWTTNSQTLNTARFRHTATLLADGKVLIAGGGNGGVVSSAEVFDPATGAWTMTVNSLNTGRLLHTATLLSNGKVLVAGGVGTNAGTTGIASSAELYDPTSGMWTTINPMNLGRYRHTATLLPNGKLLVAGGAAVGSVTNSAEIYDLVAGTWTTINSMKNPRYYQTASLLPNGTILMTGGDAVGNTAEVYDLTTGTWTTANAMKAARQSHTATMLPNGNVLVVGGTDIYDNPTAITEVYDYASGTWTNTGALHIKREAHTATLLSSGKVLVAGGESSLQSFVSITELFDPSSGTWATNNSIITARAYHTATLLPNGQVLIAGGAGIAGIISDAQLYNPTNETWTTISSMNINRYQNTATLLSNGKVLVAGGVGGSFPVSYLTNAELYDPVFGTWTPTGSMNTGRNYHTATLLPNGKVLVAGGYNANASSITLASAELYDPASGIWANTGAMNSPRENHTATLLPNGKVLIAGGNNSTNSGSFFSSAELYDPVSGIWTNTGAMNIARSGHTATIIPNGKVLVVGGFKTQNSQTSAELYDPATGSWTLTGSLISLAGNETATLMSDGRMLVTGGQNYFLNSLTNAEVYDIGLGFTNYSLKPQIALFTSPLNLGGNLVVTGAQFRGIAEGSGGNSQDSSADYPLVQLRSLESGQTVFLSPTNWGTNSFTSLPVWNFPPGYALATVFVNGIQSTSGIVSISVPVPATTILNSAVTLTNGSFQFAFTNNSGALFGVLATTNLSLPLTNWTMLNGVTEVAPGQFQFTDPQARNSAQRYYSRVFPS